MINTLRKYIKKQLGIQRIQSNEKEVLKGGTATFIYRVLSMALNYAILLIISKYYGPKGVGEYNLMTSFSSILTMIGCLGFSTSVVRFVAQYVGQNKLPHILSLHKSVIFACTILSLAITLIFMVTSKYIAEYFYNDSSLQSSFIILAVSVPFSVLTTIQVEFIRGFKKVKISEFFRSVSIVGLNTVFIFIAQFLYNQHNMPFITYCVAVFFTFLGTTLVLNKNIHELKINLNHSIDDEKKFSFRWHLITSLPMILTAFIQLINGKTNTLMIGSMLSKTELGVFTMAFKITTITNFVLGALKTIAMPKISELFWTNKKEELSNMVHMTNKLIFIFSFPVFIILLVFSNPILNWLGSEYLTGVRCMQIFACTQFINSYCGMVAVFLNMTGHQRFFLLIIGISTLLNVMLNVLWIPIYGIDGAAYSALISTLIWNVIGAIFIYQKHGIETYFNIFKQKSQKMNPK